MSTKIGFHLITWKVRVISGNLEGIEEHEAINKASRFIQENDDRPSRWRFHDIERIDYKTVDVTYKMRCG